jgi:molybdopterin converting factor small subunit
MSQTAAQRPREPSLPGTGTVRVLLFASYAERVGGHALELAIAPGATVGDVLAQVRARPGGELIPPKPLCALNLEHVSPDARVAPGDEIAILPPLAGG